MTVSIALCTYNGEKYLKPQLRSLLSQTEKALEIVICDDQSKDGTPGIIRRFISKNPDACVSFTTNEKNLHFAGNFFKAASLCSGDYVAFCDQDDVWKPEKLATVGEYLKRGKADLYIHRARVWDVSSVEAQNDLMPVMENDLYSRKLEACIGSYALGCCFIVRKSLLDLFPPFWNWDEYRIHREQHGAFVGHDMMIFAACWARKSVSIIPRTLIDYRVHGENLFGNALPSSSSGPFRNVPVKPVTTSENLAIIGHRLMSECAVLEKISLEMDDRAAQGICVLSEATRRRGQALLMRSKARNAKLPRTKRMRAFLNGLISGNYCLGPRYYGITHLSALRDIAAIAGIAR